MISVIKDSFMITSFVFLMMLIIEYINVLTKGDWQKRLTNRIWGKYLLAATLGVLPGCLGAFAVVTMYSHGLITIGAVVTTMIATSGDEAFVMLAMIPKQALLINIILFVVGMAVGTFTDFLIGKRKNKQALKCNVLKIHGEDTVV